MYIKIIPVALICILAGTAHGQGRVDNRAALASANDFLSAITDFRKAVNCVRGIRSSDRQVANLLERQAKRVVLAAKNPRQMSRLKSEWRKMEPLERKVEDKILRSYTLSRDLIIAWDRVMYRQFVFTNEYALLDANPLGGKRVQPLRGRSQGSLPSALNTRIVPLR